MNEVLEPDGDNMDADAVDMYTRSVGLIPQALDHEQGGAVRRCEREILLSIRGLGGSRGAYKRDVNGTVTGIVSEVYGSPREVTGYTKRKL